jgi:hypothetical protein
MCLNVQPFITENNVAMVPQPVLPQPLKLAPSDFFLFPVMKIQLQGRQFNGIVDTAAL